MAAKENPPSLIGSVVGGVLGAVFDTFTNFLTKPLGFRSCPYGYSPGTKGTIAESQCYPSPVTNDTVRNLFNQQVLSVHNPAAQLEDQVWGRTSRNADPFGIADSGTCPPSTVPFNGSCLETCPIGMEPTEFQEADKSKPPKMLTKVECRAACSTGLWHPLNWANDTFGEHVFRKDNFLYTRGPNTDPKHTGPFAPFDENQQNAKDTGKEGPAISKPDWCYRQELSLPITSTPDAGTWVPYGLDIYSNKNSASGGVVGFGENKLTLTEPGSYATRFPFSIGQPKMAGPCPPPNILTESMCLKPPPPGFSIVGNQFVTTQKCPAIYSTSNERDPTICTPEPIARPAYRSLLEYTISLVVIALVIVLVSKFVTSKR